MYIFYRRNTFREVRNKKPVIDAMSNLNKLKKANSISNFDLSTLYTKFPHNELLMVLNNLSDPCFEGGKNKSIVVSSFAAPWVPNIKDIKHNIICLSKHQIKDVVAYHLSNCHFTVGLALPDYSGFSISV